MLTNTNREALRTTYTNLAASQGWNVRNGNNALLWFLGVHAGLKLLGHEGIGPIEAMALINGEPDCDTSDSSDDGPTVFTGPTPDWEA